MFAPVLRVVRRLLALGPLLLLAMPGWLPLAQAQSPQLNLPRMTLSAGMHLLDVQLAQTPEQRQIRSEERRVGKECRSRWSPYH